MPNIKLVIEYDGSHFHGWQEQPGQKTVQSELHRAVELVLHEKIRCLHASGRTDAGVHAKGQVVNFACEQTPDLRRLHYALSSVLRGEVAVLSAEIVPDSFHALRDATSKQYSYTILHRPAPAVLTRGRSWHVYGPLDIEKMQHAAAVLLGEHDFSSFRGTGCEARNPVKTLFESELSLQGDFLVYRVVGSGFMKHMVRNIVGTLVALGENQLKIGSIEALLAAKDRRLAGMTAPAYALCLDWVRYEKPAR